MRTRHVFSVPFLCILTSAALGQTAGMLSFEGLIKDAGGDPVNGSIDLEFRIYDAETLRNLVDMIGDGLVDEVVGVDAKQVLGRVAMNGVPSTEFGPVVPSAFDGTERWLELSVDEGGGLEAHVRVAMITAPVAAEPLGGALPARGVEVPFTERVISTTADAARSVFATDRDRDGGSPLKRATSPSLPTSREPSRWSTPRIRAASIVTDAGLSRSPSPSPVSLLVGPSCQFCRYRSANDGLGVWPRSPTCRPVGNETPIRSRRQFSRSIGREGMCRQWQIADKGTRTGFDIYCTSAGL